MPTDTHETKHEGFTPGPWTVQLRRDGMGILPDRNSLEIVHNYPNGGGQSVIVGKHTGIDCLNTANAALIAQAPTLLAERDRLLTIQAELVRALDGMIEQYRLCMIGVGRSAEFTDSNAQVIAARAALALALSRGGAK